VLGTRVRLGDVEMLEVEVGATFRTVRRCEGAGGLTGGIKAI
jgi:hypothetical protein